MRQIAELKSLLTLDPMKAVELFDKIVGQDDDCLIQEACQTLANYIRHSSVYKRRVIYSRLQKCSLLSRMYLSFQFHNFNETCFPRKLIFEGVSVFHSEHFRREELNESHHRHHVTSVGSNRFFNLGVLSDGSPVSEPRLVSIPRVTQIEMTNTHTIFLSSENQLFGCGKAASFLPNRIEETDGGYVALPTLIEIPTVQNGEKVQKVRVTDGGTQFLIGEKWYFIGKCPTSKDIQKISSNCYVSTVEKPKNMEVLDCEVANVSFEGNSVKVYVKQGEGNRLYWDRESSYYRGKEVSFIINGYPQNARFDKVQVLNDGTIYAAKNGLFKGKLELWKNADDGFITTKGTILEHFDTKYTLIALMEEVPGTIGTEFFKVSPDGQNLIMKMGYMNEKKRELFKYKSRQTHLILKTREEQCDPVDIPMDLTICIYPNHNSASAKYPANRLLFEWMYPEYQHAIHENSIYLSQDQHYLWFTINLDSPRHLPTPSDPSSEFVPPNSDPNSIWHLISTEKQKIQCHKNLILLHSRQIVAMQRFNTNYGSFGFEEEKPEETVEIEANATAETIKNALRGMLNLETLFDIKTIELIECINFYDYHLMEEMFNDAMHILMETITEFTLPFLFELYYSFDENVVKSLVERPYLLFNSISQILPPKELLVRFADKLESENPYPLKVSEMYTNLENLRNYEANYIAKYFLNLDEDSEDVIWRSLRREFHEDLDTWHSEAMKKKEEKRAARSRNNSHTYRPETAKISDLSMTSSPIPIGGRLKTDSFSKSMNSPVQSPLAGCSMSPIGKALPIVKSRNDSISNSLEDFPEMSFSASSPSTPKSSSGGGGRFAPKGTRFKKDFDILKPQSPQNPWKTQGTTNQSIREEEEAKEMNFDEIVRKEEKLQRNIRTGFKKVQLLPHVETEELAGAQILEVFHREFHDEALICVELVMTDDLKVENEQIVWGNMPGLVRR